MSGAAKRLVGKCGKPALGEVYPGGVGRREVKGEARVSNKPTLHRRHLVGLIIVEDEVDIEIAGNLVVDLAQETEELLCSVASACMPTCLFRQGTGIGWSVCVGMSRGPLWPQSGSSVYPTAG